MGKEETALPGSRVLLTAAPPALLEGLPPEDQNAIIAAVGKPILLLRYDQDGRAELEFKDTEGVIHSVFVDPSLLRVF